MLDGLLNRFTPPALTTTRVRSAYGVAIATDVLQFILGPFGWVGADELLDVIAARHHLPIQLASIHRCCQPSCWSSCR